MFTGIVESKANVLEFEISKNSCSILNVEKPKNFDLKLGDSVSVDGCCLSVTYIGDNAMNFDVSHETISRTSFGNLLPSTAVNLERPMIINSRLDGHIVSGHVDGVAKVDNIFKKTTGWDLEISIPFGLSKYVIEKGSICFNGVSLTINRIDRNQHTLVTHITVIPITLDKTNLSHIFIGSFLNVEVDLIGKYVENMYMMSKA